MGGQWNTVDSDDGGVGFTGASHRVGVFGRNDATSPPTGGGAGGAGVFGLSVSPGAAGVFGANHSGQRGVGVQGNGPEAGISGFSTQGHGARGISQNSAAFGVFGANDSTQPPPPGSPGGAGVFGLTHSPGAAGVFGANNESRGVGVRGNGPDAGVSGFSAAGAGVRGESSRGGGVAGIAHVPEQNGMFGMNDAAGPIPSGLNRPAGSGVWGHTKVDGGSGIVGSVEPGVNNAAGVTGIGPIAGRFFGDIEVTGDVNLLGADCAEHFDIDQSQGVEPGTVMVIEGGGRLQPCNGNPYRTRSTQEGSGESASRELQTASSRGPG